MFWKMYEVEIEADQGEGLVFIRQDGGGVVLMQAQLELVITLLKQADEALGGDE